MSSAKKIGLLACTGVVAGNMMGSGIALLPANLAKIGAISVFGWVISIIGAMSLAYVYALSLIHISEPTRLSLVSRMPSSA